MLQYAPMAGENKPTFTKGHWVALAFGVGLVIWGLAQAIMGT